MVGEYIRDLLIKKEVNMSRLAEDIGIKSKTEIYRIFSNQCSPKKTAEIIGKIFSVVDINADEKAELDRLIEKGLIKGNSKKAFKILERIFKGIKIKRNNGVNSLNTFLNENTGADIKIYIGTDADINITSFIGEYTLSDPERSISISHFVNLNKSEITIANEIFSIMNLIRHNSYNCFSLTRQEFKDVCVLASSGSEHKIFLLKSSGNYAFSTISSEFYDLLIKDFSRYEHGNQLKTIYNKVTSFTQLIDMFSFMEKQDSFTFDGSFCLEDIPFETLLSMLQDANFFGFPEDSPYIKDIVNIQKQRCELRDKEGSERTVFLSEDRVITFLTTGRSLDLIPEFRSMTKHELKQMMDQLINHPNLKMRFLKPEYSIPKLNIGYVKDACVIIWDPFAQYGKGYYQAFITNPKAVKLFQGFTDYFIANCVLPEDESKNKLFELMNKYLDE